MPQVAEDIQFKVLVVGEAQVGKTCIIQRYVQGLFSTHYKRTIGVDFALKIVKWNDNTTVRLQLWDIAGQERYSNLTRVYFREAVGAFVVFDIMNPKSFELASRWKEDIDNKVFLNQGTPDERPIPCILLANKCDLLKKEEAPSYYSKAAMDRFCEKHKFIAWFEVSAKENINIDEAARFLIRRMLEDDAKPAEDPDSLFVSADDAKKSSCSC